MQFTLVINITPEGPVRYGHDLAAALGQVHAELASRINYPVGEPPSPDSGDVRSIHGDLAGTWTIAEEG